MDNETRQVIKQLRERITSVNESLDITTEALGVFMEECNSKFSDIAGTLDILIDESRFSRKQILDEIDAIRRRIDE
ncbi:MAG: hypothetical protein F6K19_32245 [Cyanothece sp. SIO1E1]|nr:hypothetical protein [Cyanothece sp. SIO1E1]